MDETILIDEIEENNQSPPDATLPESQSVDLPYDCPILDVYDNEVLNPDLSLGYLKEDVHEISSNYIPEVYHYLISYVKLSDGTELWANSEEEYDPRIEMIDRLTGQWEFHNEDPTITIVAASVNRIIDQPAIPVETHRERIMRYIYYTPQELADRQFLDEAPTRLNDAETNINDITEVVADLCGSDIEERVSDQEETIEDLLLTLAEILGGEE